VNDAGGFVEIGDNVQLGAMNFVTGQGGLIIGDSVLIAPMVSLVANEHGFEDTTLPVREQAETPRSKSVGGHGWIGTGVTVLGGVHIGDHVVIGANSVVTRDIESYCVAVGVPARVIRRLG
jgi:acetyltransferase-like isoleucine patch superfamily enzyme